MPDGSVNSRLAQMPMAHTQALFMQATAQDESRTIELVFYTGTKVQRFDWWSGETYDLEFVMDEKACDLSRLNNGAPVLNSHNSYDLSQVIGVVEKAWLKDGQGHALVRFSNRADVEPLWQDVKNGIIRNVSMGASVETYEITKNEGGRDLWRATAWQPLEISLVAVPADPNAGTRLSEQRLTLYPCRLQLHVANPSNQKEQKMAEENQPAETETPAADKPAEKVAEESKQEDQKPAEEKAADPVKEEQLRCLEIHRATRAMNLGNDVAEELIKGNVSLDAARARILNLAVESAEAAKVKATPAAATGSTETHLSVEDQAKAEWDRDEKLRSEFRGSYAAFLAYTKAEKSGRVRRTQKA